MFKAIAAYLIGRKIVGFIVCAAMMIGLLAVCLIAYAFVPEARADEMNPYAGKYYKLDDEANGTAFYVNNDGTVLVRYNDNLRVGYYFDYSVGENGEFSFPAILFGVWALKGFGMALVHNCSFPMVVELCSSKKIGKFTGFYYAASMSAQTVTPILLGLVLKAAMAWRALPVYACILTLLSCTVFTSLVRNIKAGKVANVTGIEALGADE